MTDIRYAVIGYGLAGSTFHAPLIATTPGAQLSVVVARSPETAAAARERYPWIQVVSDAAELPGLVDVAVVATPNDTHAAVATGLLESGIAAVVDKPLASTSAAAQALVDLSDRTGTPLTCHQNRRWDGDYLTVRALDLGRIHRFESRFERWRPVVKQSWKEEPGPGAGVLWDLGPHVIDQALHLLGPAVSVSGGVQTVRADARVPDEAFVRIVHDGGAESHLSVSLVAAAPGPRFRVLGTTGAYVKQGLDPQEDALRAGQVPGPGWGTEPESDWGRLSTGDPAVIEPVPTLPGDYPEFYRLLTQALRDGGPMPVDPRDSVATLRIIEEVSGEIGTA
ncbi:MAG: Gfo/Idh/MocA family oxidoreductase [Candidatus Nanopelagicales bacterium]